MSRPVTPGQEVLQSHGSGQVKMFWNLTSRVGSGRVKEFRNLAGRVGSCRVRRCSKCHGVVQVMTREIRVILGSDLTRTRGLSSTDPDVGPTGLARGSVFLQTCRYSYLPEGRLSFFVTRGSEVVQQKLLLITVSRPAPPEGMPLSCRYSDLRQHSYQTIISLFIGQCASWSSTSFITFPEEENLGNRKGTHAPSLPPFCINFRLVCSICCPCSFLLNTFYS